MSYYFLCRQLIYYLSYNYAEFHNGTSWKDSDLLNLLLVVSLVLSGSFFFKP